MPLYIQYALTFLGLIFACGYLYGQWKQGKNQSKIDSISILTSEVSILRDKVKELSDIVDKLKTENSDEKKKFIDVILTLQGKDGAMSDFMKSGNTYMLQTAPILDTLKRYLEKQVI